MQFDVQPVTFAVGLDFPEGPAFDRVGNLFVVNIKGGTVSRITPDGRVSTFVTTYDDGAFSVGSQATALDRASRRQQLLGPNGAKFHANGDLYVCEAGRKEILAIAPDGTIRSVADSCDGQRFRGPNDMVFDAEGGFYFTDPRDSDADRPIGAIYHVSAGGAVRRVLDGLAFPNGIALSADKRTLFFGETRYQRVSCCQVRGDGSLGPYQTFCQWPYRHLQDEQGPDGMAFGADGNLYATCYGQACVYVMAPTGDVLAELPAGGLNPTNVAFWGESLYVTETETNTVQRLDIGVRGQALP